MATIGSSWNMLDQQIGLLGPEEWTLTCVCDILNAFVLMLNWCVPFLLSSIRVLALSLHE